MNYIAVGIGGGLGAMLRYILSQTIVYTNPFPFVTILINAFGSLLFGYIFGRQLFHRNDLLRLAFTTGILGGFTTFSTFSLETLQLLQQGHVLIGISYACISAIGCVLFTVFGLIVGKKKGYCEMIYVGIGGILGAMARFFFSNMIHYFPQRPKFLATLFVNYVGSFLLGMLANLAVNDTVYAILGIGFLGAFTTFSTFSFEIVQLIEKKQWKVAILYLVSSIIGGILLASIGFNIFH